MTSFFYYVFMLMAVMVVIVKANMSPSNPEPGTVWTSGKEYEITWEEDNTEPTINATWKNFRIDLMTGEDNDQILLTNIAENVKGSAMKYKYKAPEVNPHAPIYFLMFTSENGEYAWSTRFAIVGQDGKQDVPEKSVQPNGEKIPWGIGKLGSDAAESPRAENGSEAEAEEGKTNSAAAISGASVPATAAHAVSSQAAKSVGAASRSEVASSAASPSAASVRKMNGSEKARSANSGAPVSLFMSPIFLVVVSLIGLLSV